jgi:hypothetical protein
MVRDDDGVNRSTACALMNRLLQSIVKSFPDDISGAFAVFALSIFSMIFVEVFVLTASNILWVDFLHDNPNRSHANALIIPIVIGIPIAIWLILDMFGAFMLALLVVYCALRIFKRFPFWIAVILISVCALAIYYQDNTIPTLHMFFDTPEMEASAYSPIQRTLSFTGFFAPALLVAWLLVRMSLRPQK